ncbi:MAG TPA: signal peptidase I [Candidatus Eisenbacteria bacterium]|nr:signal peptidase I [Candidatus Eisenbacteria bacterium]
MQERTSNIIKKISFFLQIIIFPILVIVLIINGTMLIKAYRNPEELPDFIGYKPLIVLSGSMEPIVTLGDLAFVKITPIEDITENDIIAFRQNKSDKTAVLHRVKEKTKEDGEIAFVTKGDANPGVDDHRVKPDEIDGKYIGKIAKLGRLALFLQTPTGMFLLVILPLVLLLTIDYLLGKGKTTRERELEAELAALKAKNETNKDEEKNSKNKNES